MANEQLYIEYRGDEPVAYRYGEPWVAMQLAMEGGYDTPEEAMKQWEEWKAVSKHDTPNNHGASCGNGKADERKPAAMGQSPSV